MVAKETIEYLEKGKITNTVNFPNLKVRRKIPFRLEIAKSYINNKVGPISTSMANAGLNIRNMGNKSRGEMAYTLVDVDSPVPQKAIEKLGLIPGVLMVRYLPTLAN